MRYVCTFEDDGGTQKTIHASLSAHEVKSVESMRDAKGADKAEHLAAEYALRAAYREVPRGFRHLAPPELIAPTVGASEMQAMRLRCGVA